MPVRDKHVFRVPSLRMAMYTAPYFHDGSVNDLKDAAAIITDSPTVVGDFSQTLYQAYFAALPLARCSFI